MISAHKNLQIFSVAIAPILLGLCACEKPLERSRDDGRLAAGYLRTANTSPNIVAGPGERSFTEKYDLDLHLPISEQKFLMLLTQLNLKYELYLEARLGMSVPQPRYDRRIDAKSFVRCYQIYGEVDRDKRTAEVYRAFVDVNSMVVYVENNFVYSYP